MWVVVIILAFIVLSSQPSTVLPSPVNAQPGAVGGAGIGPHTTRSLDPAAQTFKTALSDVGSGNLPGAGKAIFGYIGGQITSGQLFQTTPGGWRPGDGQTKAFVASETPAQKIQAAQLTSTVWAQLKARGL